MGMGINQRGKERRLREEMEERRGTKAGEKEMKRIGRRWDKRRRREKRCRYGESCGYGWRWEGWEGGGGEI